MRRWLDGGDAERGELRMNRGKLLRIGGGAALGLAGLVGERPGEVLLALVLSGWPAMALGVLGFHRLVIHRSFVVSGWLKKLILLGATQTGMGGILSIIRMHELRDWAQNQTRCHDFFAHRGGFLRDLGRNLFCDFVPSSPPDILVPEEQDSFHLWLERSWLWHQVAAAVLLGAVGGFPWLAGGVGLRLAILPLAYWSVAWLIHQRGECRSSVPGAAVQGRNLPGLAALSLGECWHNNHHRWPEAAVTALPGQWDPCGEFIQLLSWLGLARELRRIGEVEDRCQTGRLSPEMTAFSAGRSPTSAYLGRKPQEIPCLRSSSPAPPDSSAAMSLASSSPAATKSSASTT